MGHTASCQLCGWSDTWSSQDAAGCAATWHVYENHPAAWKAMFGLRPPSDPHPEVVGTRL